MLHRLVRKKPDNWYFVLTTAEFDYNNSVKSSIDHSPFEIAHDLKPHYPINLTPLPYDACPSEFAHTFAQHL